jgi:uncharacterized protein with NAD-binding domain and iron-sulfur cluster
MQPSAAGPTRVVILGGGPAALAAAFWLTSTDALRARYQVTIYTPGWRLGGKCASGRDLTQCDRIEEHGLHILMGCYHYAFHTIRQCFEEWQPLPGGPFQTWTDAFAECYDVSLGNVVSTGSRPKWEFWNFRFPQLAGLPGDVDSDGGFVDAIWDCATPPMLEPLMSDFTRWLEDHVVNNVQLEVMGGIDYHATLQQARETLAGKVDADVGALVGKLDTLARGVQEAVLALPAAAMAATATTNAPATATSAGAGLVCPFACALVLAELGFWLTSGYIKALIENGGAMIDRLNAYDFRQWLSSLGVSDRSLSSPPIRALYDLAFAYRGGDASNLDNGSMAAGVTLRLVLEMTFGYRRAPLWRMNAGTADTVFTPLYEVLSERGVCFKFFHRLSGLGLSGQKIGVIDLEQQAAIVGGKEYEPLVTVGKLGCWPNAPAWDQLVDGEELRQRGVNFESPDDPTTTGTVTLNVGQHFDLAVLAVPPEVIKQVADGVKGIDSRWDAMLESSASVATEAFQLWMKPDLASLGWPLGPTVVTSFAEPFDSWADMSQLLSRESWGSGANAPHSIHYFCGCFPDSESTPDPAQDAGSWLTANIASLWPNAASPGGPLNPALVASAYFRANFRGSQRYVQTPAGTVASRLSPSAPIFGNLYVAGDWTLTRFSGGCFESAMESGTLAASAICGVSVLQSLVST